MTDGSVRSGERPLYEIAREVRATWPKVWFGARPYLDAMASLAGMGDRFGAEYADDIVMYFLSNAKTWKGEDAKRIKAELRSMLKARGR